MGQASLGREELVALDKQHVWHPYTPMGRYVAEADPLVVQSASGCWLEDVDGRRYLDGNASWWVSVLGHNHPRLVRALREQAERMCHVSLAQVTHEPAARLAQELVARAPSGLSRVFYSDNGSTAVEVAIKICLQYWQQVGYPRKRRFIALSDAFHGETLGVTALGGVEVFRRPFASALMECLHVSPQRGGYEQAFAALEAELRGAADSIAGVVVEPLLQGAGGMRVYPAEYLRALREWTRRSHVFLVVDEVFTGYGRTGTFWACEQAAISPDLMCIGKGFSGGILPMAATLATESVFDGFLGADERALFYGHTYCGHPLGAAVAREVLRIYEEEAIVERSQPKAEMIAAAVERWCQLPGVSEGRSLGMMGAVRVGAGHGYLARAGWRVTAAARRRGAYIRPLGDVVYVTPPINIPDPELEQLLGIVEESLREELVG